MIKKNTISWDFDGTLDDHFNGEENSYKYETRDILKRLLTRGYDIYIITRRFGPENSEKGITNEHLKVWEVADELGISRDKIIFANRLWKFSIIQSIGACMHIDDDEEEMYWLEKNAPDVTQVWLGDKNWKNTLIQEIDTHDHISTWFTNENNILLFGLFVAIIMTTILLIA